MTNANGDVKTIDTMSFDQVGPNPKPSFSTIIEGSNNDDVFKKTRSKNSWILNYNSNGTIKTQCRQSITLLGVTIPIHENMYKRKKWGERGTALFGLISLLLYIFDANDIVFGIFMLLTIICNCIIYYKNISLSLFKRLMLKELNVIIILCLAMLNVVIEIIAPNESISIVFDIIYFMVVSAYILYDAVKIKSRAMVLIMGIIFIVLSLWNIYKNVFLGSNTINGVEMVVSQYTVDGEQYEIYKRASKRSVYVQILLFSMEGVYVMVKDRNMELMIFATGNIDKKKVVAYTYNNDDDQRNIYGGGDEEEWKLRKMYRIKWAERGTCVFGGLGLLTYLLVPYSNIQIFLCIPIVCIGLCFIGGIYYKNFSYTVAKLLFKQPNVMIIVTFAFFNFLIDISGTGENWGPPGVLGTMYFLLSTANVFLDAIIHKSRGFVIVAGFIFALTNLYNIYGTIFAGGKDKNAILLQYTIHGRHFTILKRSTKRSIYIQILFLSANGLWVMVKDKKAKLMMYITENIFRNTGTSLKKREDDNMHINDAESSKKMAAIEVVST